MSALLETKEEFELGAKTIKSWFKPGTVFTVPAEQGWSDPYAGKLFLSLGSSMFGLALVSVLFLSPEGEAVERHFSVSASVSANKQYLSKWKPVT